MYVKCYMSHRQCAQTAGRRISRCVIIKHSLIQLYLRK